MSPIARNVLMGALMLLIGLLALQALAYGIGFALDPEGNADLAIALGAASAGQWWDAGFYGVTGAALIVLAAAVRWLQGRPQSGATGAAPNA